MTSVRPKTVDEYIINAPKEVREKLKELRTIIKANAPEAQEKISYGMPYYGHKGRLVYFAYFKNHIGFYIMPPIIEDFKNELKDYVTSIGTVRFPLDQKLPTSLIKRMMKARVALNNSKK